MLEATLYPTKRAKSQSNKDLNLGDESRTVTIEQSKKRRRGKKIIRACLAR